MPRKKAAAGQICSFRLSSISLQPAGMRIGDDKADVGRDGSDVGDMIADSFEFQKDGPHDQTRAGELPSRPRARWPGRNAVPCEKLESPEMLSARKTALCMGSFSKSFSVPLWV